MINIVFLDTDTLGQVDLEPIMRLGHFSGYPDTTPHQVVERSRHAQVIVTNKVKLTAEVLDALPNLQLICIAATGTNNVDLDHAAHKGIEVRNVAGYSTHSVAQTTFALLLGVMQQTCYFDHYVKSGNYARSTLFTNHQRSFCELAGKQYGIIGLGSIGRQVATIAQAFGAKVAYFSTSGSNLTTDYTHLPLNTLLATSDVISIHAPLSKRTYNLIDYPQLQQMKPTAYLVNTGRGKIVNEQALAQALDQGLLAGAALDVFEQEPISADNPLLRLAQPHKIMLSPHVAWASVEARRTLVQGVAGNISSYFASKP